MATTFEEALKSTLQNINTSFDEADGDLHRVVASVSKALGDVTKILLVALNKVGENEEGTSYQLILTGPEVATNVVAGFFVPAKGYPIKCQTRTGALSDETYCKDKQELEKYFAAMASNPDSPLVTRSAFLMRSKKGAQSS